MYTSYKGMEVGGGGRVYCLEEKNMGIQPQGADPPPHPLFVATPPHPLFVAVAGKNYLIEEITPSFLLG